MNKHLYLLLFFLIIHSDFRFKFIIPNKKIRFACLYHEDTSSVSKVEIIKFLNSFRKFRADWFENLKEILEGYDYLVLSKGNLNRDEENLIFDFLINGGGLILFLPKSYDEEFLKKIGIRSYEIYTQTLNLEFDQEIFRFKPEGKFSPYKGILIKTGFGGKITMPKRGNVFPERIPVRDFKILTSLRDENKNLIAGQILLVRHWLNPWQIEGRIPNNWLLFSCQDMNFRENFYYRLSRLILNPIFIKDVKARFPIFEPGERIDIFLEVYNSGKNENRAKVVIEISSLRNICYKYEKNKYFLPGMNQIRIRLPQPLSYGYYILKAGIYEKDEVIDYGLNAFVIKGKNWDRQGPQLEIKNNAFLINGNKKFLSGINYYESNFGELMWLYPNLYRINEDFKLMKNFGFDIVRIHYHHPKWFRDYLKRVHSPMLKFFPQKEYLPSEEDLRILDSIIYLAQLNDLIICLDLFSLVPEEMGNPLGWLGMEERMKEDKIKPQLEFVRIIAQRYKNIPNITWDLWNEPDLDRNLMPELKKWAEKIIQEFRNNNDKHLITIGGNDSLYLADILDYISIHTNEIDRFKVLTLEPDKVIIIQEFWLAYDLNEELQQAEELKVVLEKLKQSNYQGFLPWQWTRQSRLWDKSLSEKWDNDLGLFLREDGSLKPTRTIFSH